MRFAWRDSARVLCWLGLFLVLANVLAVGFDHWAEVRVETHARDSYGSTWWARGYGNPHFRRHWARFVARASVQRSDALSVVLVSNSQGYGCEVPPPHSYPVLLHQLLEGRLNRPVDLYNWSVPGGSGPEMMILVAAARKQGADLVAVVATPSNFSKNFGAHGRWRLRQLGSDVPDLLGDDGVRRHLPSGFALTLERPKDRVDRRLRELLPLWRYRDRPKSILLSGFNPFLDPLGTDLTRNTWTLHPVRSRELAEVLTETPRRPIEPHRTGNPSSALLELLTETLSRSSNPSLFVAMPLHSSWRRGLPAALTQTSDVLGQSSIEVLDLSSAVPDDEFLTGSHLDEEGHQRLADVLAAEIAKTVITETGAVQ